MTQELDSAARSDTIPGERASTCALRVGFLARIASSLLLYPGYRRLWISNLFFFGGLWTQTLVLGWLVFETTRSEFSVALFTAARLGPMMLGPLAGVISDRFDRPRLLLAASGWAFAVLSVIALLVALDKISFWGLVFGGFCIGLAQSPSQPARFALVADLVDREKLSNANALNSLVLSLTQMIGPALGGTMILAFGAASALAISACWYLISFVALWPMRNLKSSRQPDREESFASLVAAGFRTISGNVLLRSVLAVTFLANILLWPIYQGFMPVIAKEHMGLTPQGLGLLLTCAGTGSLAGALVIASLGDFRYKGGLFLIGTAIWGALWATFALSSSVPPIVCSHGAHRTVGVTVRHPADHAHAHDDRTARAGTRDGHPGIDHRRDAGFEPAARLGGRNHRHCQCGADQRDAVGHFTCDLGSACSGTATLQRPQ